LACHPAHDPNRQTAAYFGSPCSSTDDDIPSLQVTHRNPAGMAGDLSQPQAYCTNGEADIKSHIPIAALSLSAVFKRPILEIEKTQVPPYHSQEFIIMWIG
jgi:hypothetical protein